MMEAQGVGDGGPLGVECEGGAVGERTRAGWVREFLSIVIRRAAAVGFGVPSIEGIAAARHDIGFERLRLVVGEGLVCHRDGGTVVILLEGDTTGGPAGVELRADGAGIYPCARDGDDSRARHDVVLGVVRIGTGVTAVQ